MRWLCDENIPRRLVDVLRHRGHDVIWIREDFPGIADADVLALAIRQRRVCLTFDKDFGELIGSTELPLECGVVLLRVPAHGSLASAEAIVTILGAGTGPHQDAADCPDLRSRRRPKGSTRHGAFQATNECSWRPSSTG